MIRRWLREPLIHFLAAGAAIWLGLSFWGDPVDPADRTIVISREKQAGLVFGFERMMGRPPTDGEYRRLIERFIREEILYREALRLGIDRDDAVVRRRLSTKMDEIAGAEAETARVDEAMLARWLEEHPARFSRGGTVAFDQRFFPTEQAARAALGQSEPVGTPISLPRSVADFTAREVDDVFGRQFKTGLDDLDPSADWQGPVASGFGWHLVRLVDRRPGYLPPLGDIRDEVETDWRSGTIAARRERAYRVLRDAYRVEVE